MSLLTRGNSTPPAHSTLGHMAWKTASSPLKAVSEGWVLFLSLWPGLISGGEVLLSRPDVMSGSCLLSPQEVILFKAGMNQN